MDTLRFTLAFLFAPLAIPAIEFRPWESHGFAFETLALTFLAAVLAYAGAFIFGIPTCLLFARRQWMALWSASLAGFVVAAMTWWFVGLVPLVLFSGSLADLTGPDSLPWLAKGLWLYGPLGAAVTSLLWGGARLQRGRRRDGTG
jgi:hypothetical protein